MSDPMEQLIRFVSKATRAVAKDDAGPYSVDMHFFIVDFTEWSANKEEFFQLLNNNEHGIFADISRQRWLAGPSYIEVGGWIGDQGLAMRFMALGKHYEAWDIFTPGKFGIEGEKADQIAGGGGVMIIPTEATTMAIV